MVLIITALFPPEQVVSAEISYELALRLSEEHSVTVLCPKPSRPYGAKFNYEQNVLTSPFKTIITNSYIYPKSKLLGRIRESISFGMHCYRFIRKNKSSINVIYHNSWPLFSQSLIVLAAKKEKIPVFTHVHDIYPESLIRKAPKILKTIFLYFFRAIDNYTLKNSSGIFVISEQMKSYLCKNRTLMHNPISVVRNWQDFKPFEKYFEYKKQDTTPFTFMFLGNVSETTGLNGVIHAFGKASLIKSKLIIAGSGSYIEVLKKIATQYPTETIEFCDAPKIRVPEIQSKADVFLLPLKHGVSMTASPSKLPAYMFSGKPIIASVDAGSDVDYIISEANCGVCVRPDNEEDLIMAMKYFHSMHEDERMEFGKNGRSFALEHLTKEKNLSIIAEVIKDKLLIQNNK